MWSRVGHTAQQGCQPQSEMVSFQLVSVRLPPSQLLSDLTCGEHYWSQILRATWSQCLATFPGSPLRPKAQGTWVHGMSVTEVKYWGLLQGYSNSLEHWWHLYTWWWKWCVHWLPHPVKLPLSSRPPGSTGNRDCSLVPPRHRGEPRN